MELNNGKINTPLPRKKSVESIPHALDGSDRSDTSDGSMNHSSEVVQKYMIEAGFEVHVSLANLSDESWE
jgi:hypothetical protein